jgi:hypothetical protein
MGAWSLLWSECRNDTPPLAAKKEAARRIRLLPMRRAAFLFLKKNIKHPVHRDAPYGPYEIL